MEEIKILIVEDDRINANLLAKRFEKRGYLVDVVYNGNDCLAKVESDTYQLLILDMILPDVSGLEVLRHLRQNHTALNLPIIVASAKNDVDSLVECLKEGANDFIQKPINIEIADARIKVHLSSSESHRGDHTRRKLEEICLKIKKHSKDLGEHMADALGKIQVLKENNLVENLDEIEENLSKVSTILNQLTELSIQNEDL